MEDVVEKVTQVALIFLGINVVVLLAYIVGAVIAIVRVHRGGLR